MSFRNFVRTEIAYRLVCLASRIIRKDDHATQAHLSMACVAILTSEDR